MLTRDDLIDLIVAGLSKADAAAGASGRTEAPRPARVSSQGPSGRTFLSEYEIKKRLTAAGNRLTIPKDSIVSPLALEWLTLKGIQIVRE